MQVPGIPKTLWVVGGEGGDQPPPPPPSWWQAGCSNLHLRHQAFFFCISGADFEVKCIPRRLRCRGISFLARCCGGGVRKPLPTGFRSIDPSGVGGLLRVGTATGRIPILSKTLLQRAPLGPQLGILVFVGHMGGLVFLCHWTPGLPCPRHGRKIPRGPAADRGLQDDSFGLLSANLILSHLGPFCLKLQWETSVKGLLYA